MRDIQIKENNQAFNCRVVGVCEKNNKILLCRLKSDDYWTFVGGKVAFGESTEEAIVREYREETSANVQVDHLVSVIENFFTLDEKEWHQFIFFYQLKDESNELDLFDGERTVADDENAVYKWFDLSELNSVVVKPNCSLGALKNLSSTNIMHIVNRDE